MSNAELKRILSFCRQTAERAGAILARGFNRSHQRVAFKGRIDPVTEYDLKSERYITGQIKKKYPDHAILTEEGTATGKDSQSRWIIDPLDGTVNFAHGFPVYCVSIGFEHQGNLTAGAVYDPERHELFSAARGQGAFLNGKRIQVGKERRLKQSGPAVSGACAGLGGRQAGDTEQQRQGHQDERIPEFAFRDLHWSSPFRVRV